MARTKPGMDFPALLESVLCQRGKQWNDDDGDDDREVDGDDDGEVDGVDWFELPKRVTVRDVLKYSLTWVIIPWSETVQAWTQKIWRFWSQPSTRTVEPREAIERGTNWNLTFWSTPVNNRIIYWWEGGPWNHHSMSESSNRWTVSTSRILRASYRARTTLMLKSVSDSRLDSWELASSVRPHKWKERLKWIEEKLRKWRLREGGRED